MSCYNCGSPKHKWTECPKPLSPALLAKSRGKGNGKPDKGKGKYGKGDGKSNAGGQAAEPAGDGPTKKQRRLARQAAKAKFSW